MHTREENGSIFFMGLGARVVQALSPLLIHGREKRQECDGNMVLRATTKKETTTTTQQPAQQPTKPATSSPNAAEEKKLVRKVGTDGKDYFTYES